MRVGLRGLGRHRCSPCACLHRASLLTAACNRTADKARTLAAERELCPLRNADLAATSRAVGMYVAADADVLDVVGKLACKRPVSRRAHWF